MAVEKLGKLKPGKLKPQEYDAMVGDLVAYLKYMGEPVAEFRKKLGVIVLIFLVVMTALIAGFDFAFSKAVLFIVDQ